MVRDVKSPPEEIVSTEDDSFKSSICQPKDNIGTSGIFSSDTAESGTKVKPSTGVRRKYAIPKDNLGVACLPTTEYLRHREVPEMLEHDPVEEIYSNANDNIPTPSKQEVHSKTTKTGRARCTPPKDNLSSSGRHVNEVRLRGGEDGSQVIRDESRNRSDVFGGTATPIKPKGNVGFFEEGESNEELIQPNKTMQFRSTPLDIGISNIRRPKHDPTKPRKLIVPKDNLGFSGRHLQKSLIRPNGPKTTATSNIKKISRKSEKKESSLKSLSNWFPSEKQTIQQNKSLNTNRHIPK